MHTHTHTKDRERGSCAGSFTFIKLNHCYFVAWDPMSHFCSGGDDVQQLCEAGEDEFLEIMALVGMAAKPLHVRRLQKALQEWVANPAALEANGMFIFLGLMLCLLS